jgi:hypothetical protein
MQNILKYWTPKEFEISSYRWHLKERINKKYNTSGSDNTGLCTYTYNELGFRGDSIHKEGFKVMSIGCSLTEGVGVNNNETWPFCFSELIPNGINMNFGTGGRSNDFIARCLLTYYNLIKPDLVLIMYTLPFRKEIYTKSDGVEPYTPTSSWGYTLETEDGKFIQKTLTSIQNENEDFNNWYKNHLLIKYFLETKNCNWLWNGAFLSFDYNEKNRFDGNFKNFIDKGVDNDHPGPIHNKIYSETLYKHIYTNFREYLPNNCIDITKKII